MRREGRSRGRGRMRIEGEERKGEGINEFGEGGGEMADKEI